MKKALFVLLCLIAGTAAVLMATGCSPPPSGSLNLPILTSTGTKESFQAELLSGYPDNDYANNSQTWCYNVTVLAEKGDLSHWCLDLCDEPEHNVLSWSGPAEKIEYTDPKWDGGNHGHIIKWDGTTLKPGESAVFCFTLENIWEPAQVKWFAKNGAPWGLEEPEFADTGWVTGPSCLPLCVLPNADFLADKNEVCAGTEIIFTDISTPDDITAWSWFFPEGNPSSADTQGPHTVTYEDPGVYTVSLNVSNSCGSHAKSKTNYITVKDCTPCVPPTADFVADKNNVCAGAEIIFSDISTPNNITSWNWSFPGGNPSSADTQGSHVVIYNSSGNYTVSLNVSNNCGSDAETKTNYITVKDCAPTPLTVGWEVYPVNKIAALAPWIVLFIFIVAASTTLLVRQVLRHR